MGLALLGREASIEALPDAFVVDVDGVLVDTARVHFDAWARLIDEIVDDGARLTQEEYDVYIDGRSRLDGLGAILDRRQIDVPRGQPSDPSTRRTVHGLAARKQELFLDELGRHGARAFPDASHFLATARASGVPVAAASASRNCRPVLEAAGLIELTTTVVDGIDAERERLAGKPSPDLFLYASARVGVRPERAMVIEDAVSGVEAARRGRFGVVVAIDRNGSRAAEFARAGAHQVVRGLREVLSLG